MRNCCGATTTSLTRWSVTGLIACTIQFITMVIQYTHTQSQTIVACTVIAGLFMALYCLYVFRIRSQNHELLVRYGKYFILLHLLTATWYFWIALTVFLFHLVGFSISDVLSGPLAFSSTAMGVLASFFVLTVLIHIAELYTTVFHAKRMLSGALAFDQDIPRGALLFTGLTDFVVLGFSVWCYKYSDNEHGLIAVMVLSLVSAVFQMRHARTALRKQMPFTMQQHSEAQLLALQHMVFSSTIFLVNYMVVMVSQINTSVSRIIDDDNGSGDGTFIILSIIAYIIMFCTSVVLVRIHVLIDSGTPLQTEGEPVVYDDGSGYYPVAIPSGGAYITQD